MNTVLPGPEDWRATSQIPRPTVPVDTHTGSREQATEDVKTALHTWAVYLTK